ncbi:MAG: circularly permuted type 2 ATP-grasp protein [Microbacterium sp.]|uniref:circularly permuted type 2 ATP-grasp protein n=1 Tax=Microbacterium sp. TaxID=51671 RepID=UPI00262F1315|nr:circularly permuted type 2 ATP-grasp protein [Microbacterium sp.]MCX6503261.1 circularly permuted type 2 ATP-grasp protein [Microbacterium sp.]
MRVLREYAASLASPTLPLPGIAAPRYDEVVDADGALRPSWKSMAASAYDLTTDELRRIDVEIATLLSDDGVTYEHPDAGSVPWGLDPVPLVLDAATWSRLDVGLAQRAELLSALLEDLYDQQRVLADGIVPAAAVFGHSGFVRPLVRAGSAATHKLVLSGADLGRDAAGEWRVLADRVQAPSGLGFAMENRRVISRVLPDLYQEAGLHRMEPYFAAVRASLLQAAPAGVSDPRVVVLSPGTHSETAYDQAFLANVLGFPLVQGGDLVLREGTVWMKPSGFPRRAPVERVDVILRRVDAEWCDPLELRAGSQLGLPGLVEAVRRGTVTVVNGLGAGVLENPALLPFLPALCERLLGEQLRLPSVPTWWGGEPEGLERILDAIGGDDLSIRRIDGRTAALAALPADEVRGRILAEPYRYVGRELLPLSQAPAWAGGKGTVPRQVTLRTFTVYDGSVYRPLIGGLATLADAGGLAPVTKDVWVLKGAPDDRDQGLADLATPALSRSTPAIGPRALEDMFWAGRYAERAEDLLRLVITTQAYAEQLEDASTTSGGRALGALHRATTLLCGRRHTRSADELRSLLLDADRAGSAAHSFERLRDALEGVRDQLSNDTWRVFGAVERSAAALRLARHPQGIPDAAGRMLTGVLSLQGVTANMIQDSGWHMIELGRYLERALQVALLLQGTVTSARGADAERAVLEATLMAAESSVTHRRRHRGDARMAGALELLLTDAANPRSVAFALERVTAHLDALPSSTGSTRPERLVEDLLEMLRDVSVADLTVEADGVRPALAAFLDDLIEQGQRLSDAILQVHVESGPPAQSLTLLEEEAAS